MVKKLGFVRQAVDADIAIIRAWLDSYPEVDSLSDNWHITLQVYRTKGMLVFEEHATQLPVAYFWGDFAGVDSVLEVQYDKRMQGIGKEFVEHLLTLARQTEKRILTVECAPPTSLEFWRRMGFTVLSEGRKWIGKRDV